MANETLTLVQRLEKMQEMVEVIRKNKSNFKGKYVSEDELLAKVAAGKKKYNVFLKQQIVPGTAEVTHIHYTKQKVLKSGDVIDDDVSLMLVRGELIYTWINCDDPSDTMEVPWFFCGVMEDAAQALGSALTYANRYFQLKFFQIATPDDDPDNWRSKKEEAEEEAQLAVAKEIVTKIDGYVHSYLDLNDNSDEARKKLTELVKQYVKNGSKPTADYLTYLTDPQVAVLLLSALQEQCPLEKAPAPVKTTKKNGGNT